MSVPTCRPDGFATRRLAARRAWLISETKRVEPYQCDERTVAPRRARPGRTDPMTATRAEYTEALTHSNDAFEEFTKHLQACPACRPVRLDCPVRDGLYNAASHLRQVVDDIVTGWAEARRSAAATDAPDAEPR